MFSRVEVERWRGFDRINRIYRNENKFGTFDRGWR